MIVTNVLKRFNVKAVNPETGPLNVYPNDIIDSGSYCNIVLIKEGVLRKELKSVYQEDEMLIKRMKIKIFGMYDINWAKKIYFRTQ